MNAFTGFRLYLKLNPFVKQLKGEFKMKFSWNMIAQILGTVIQAANAAAPVLGGHSQIYISAGVAVLQAFAGLFAHFSNPDGTSAAAPYIKSK